MKEKLIKFFKDEEGIETIEYALIAGLVAIAVIVGATFLGNATNNLYNGTGDVIESVGPTAGG
jgi:pilus assembly protein Flp/PilA